MASAAMTTNGMGRLSWELQDGFGAHVAIDPSALQAGLTGEEAITLAGLLYRQGYIELKGQSLDAEQFRAFAGIFGNLPPVEDEANPVLAVDKAIGGFGTAKLMWHRDMSFSDHPFDAIALHALDVNPGETGTSVASGVHAYRTLPERTCQRIEGLTTLTAVSGNMQERPRFTDTQSIPGWPQAVHPLVSTHPRTGEKVLLICPMCTVHIRELEPAASEDLLAELFEHITQAANVHRHDWYDGDIFVWDNYGCVHARDNLAGVTRRTLRRATIGEQSFRQAYPDWDMRRFTDRHVEKNYMGSGAAY
jgi:taurine dioxygenase